MAHLCEYRCFHIIKFDCLRKICYNSSVNIVSADILFGAGCWVGIDEYIKRIYSKGAFYAGTLLALGDPLDARQIDVLFEVQ